MTDEGTEGQSSSQVPGVSEAMARTLRHEIGDFLQKVYATVAILRERLPAEWTLEQDILGRLRFQAENCKNLIDSVQDFLSPLTLAIQPIEFVQMLKDLVASLEKKFPKIEIQLSSPDILVVEADPRRIAKACEQIVVNACEAAEGKVSLVLEDNLATNRVEFTVTDDGSTVTDEILANMFQPFFTTRSGHAGLGLTLAKKVLALHGGTVQVENGREGGCRVRTIFPTRMIASR